MDLRDYGFTPDGMPENGKGIPARITAVHKQRYGLVCAYGETYGRLKTKEYYRDVEAFPTVGDFVLINYLSGGDSQIMKTLPRKTFFSRRDPAPGGGEQAVAANFDYVFIMQSLNQNFNEKRLERYLTPAWQSGAVPVVVLTKADLTSECDSYIRIAKGIASDVSVLAVSSKTGAGLDALAGYMTPGKTVVFLGSSGVGKSSLVNALAGEEVMAVQEIRSEDGRGRHTTTHRQLLMLGNGAMIIDTPGMRELGMWDVSEGFGEAFADVEQYLGRCRFGNCRHQSEPGCAVREAIEQGLLSKERWDSYSRLKKEAKYTDDKRDFMQKRQQRNKKAGRQKNEKLSGQNALVRRSRNIMDLEVFDDE